MKKHVPLLLLLVLTLCACTPAEEPSVTFQPPGASAAPGDWPEVTLWVGIGFDTYAGPGTFPQYFDKTFEDALAPLNEQGAPARLVPLTGDTASFSMTSAEWNAVHDSLLEYTVRGNALADFPLDLFLDNAGPTTQYHAHEGLALDITDKVTREHPGLFAAIPERAWRETMVDGRIYAIPLPNDVFGTEDPRYGFDVWPVALDALGLAMPDSPEALLRALRAAKEHQIDDPGFQRTRLLVDPAFPPYPLHRAYPEWPFFVDEQMRFIYYNDGTVGPYIGSEIFRRDAVFLTTLLQEGLLLRSDKATTQTRETAFASFYPIRAANPYYGDSDGEYWLPTTVLPYTGIFAPEVPFARVGPWAQKAFYISPHSKEVDLSLQMLELLYANPAVFQALSTPLEGDTFTIEAIVEGGVTIAPAEEITNWAREVTGRGEPIPGSLRREPQIFHDMFRFDPQETPPPGLSAVDFIGRGFLFDQTIVEQPEWWSETARQQVYSLLVGAVPIEALDEEIQATLAGLETQGYQQLLDACQAQYTAYIQRFE